MPVVMAGPPGSPADAPGLFVTDFQYHTGRAYVGVVSVLFVISTLILIMRIVSRWKTTCGLAADDYLIISAGVRQGLPS